MNLNNQTTLLSINHHDTEIAYEHSPPTSIGKATVVFLPGLFAGGWMWDAQRRRSAELGYGTISITEAYAKLNLGKDPVTSFRACLETLFDKHQVTEAIICGNSIGGLMAVDYGVSGERPAHVLGSGIPGIGKIELPGIALYRTPTDEDLQLMLEGIFHDHRNIKPDMAGKVADCFNKGNFPNLVKYLLAVRRYPIVANVKRLAGGGVTLVWGDEDRITPKELWHSALAHELTSGAIKLVTIANSGHSPMLENSVAFDGALEAALLARRVVAESRVLRSAERA